MTFYDFRKIIKESLLLLIILLLIEILAGQILNTHDDLVNIPIILASVPVVNGIGGNLGSILGARLTSGLHVGYMEPKFNDRNLISNIFGIIGLAVVVFSVLVVLMVFILPITGIPLSIPVFEFVIVVLGAGLIMTSLVVVLGVFSAFYAFKHGMDPDNIVTPIITTSGDMLGISMIIVMSLIIAI